MAQALGYSSRYVSLCIRSKHACSFANYVNLHRVNHAKQLLKQHPEMKLSAIASESGFANETSFFRTFKAFTFTTPREWLKS